LISRDVGFKQVFFWKKTLSSEIKSFSQLDCKTILGPDVDIVQWWQSIFEHVWFTGKPKKLKMVHPWDTGLLLVIIYCTKFYTLDCFICRPLDSAVLVEARKPTSHKCFNWCLRTENTKRTRKWFGILLKNLVRNKFGLKMGKAMHGFCF